MKSTPVAVRLERLSTRIVFFIMGLAAAAWAPLVPFAKQRGGLDDGTLGLLLLCLGVGSIMTMTLAGALAARFGCRRVVIWSAAPLCLSLPVLAAASDPAVLAIALLVFGAGLGAIDVTINIQAVIVERASGRALMSGFHALYSIGGIAGAAGIAAFLGVGVSPIVATLCVTAGIVLAVIVAGPHVLPYGSEGAGPAFAVPRGIVLFIGVLCFIAFLAEGAMLDWSAVFLTSAHDMPPAQAGLGYATFALAMSVGRLLGDRIVQQLGGGNVIIFGGLCAAIGFAAATFIPSWKVALPGFALIGVGCANIVPVLYTAVGRQTILPQHVAVSAITTLGYSGILAGPAAIGFVAHATSLSIAFLILAMLQLGVAASGFWMRERLR